MVAKLGPAAWKLWSKTTALLLGLFHVLAAWLSSAGAELTLTLGTGWGGVGQHTTVAWQLGYCTCLRLSQNGFVAWALAARK